MQNLMTLVLNARAGDAQSFGKIYDLFIDRIYRFIFFRVAKKEDAEDLTEQVFLKTFEHLASFEYQGCPFEAWIFRIARNVVIDFYRTKKLNLPLSEKLPESTRSSPEEITEQKLSKQTLLKAIGKLPDNYQEAIILKYIDQRSSKEIGLMLNKPEDYVRVLLNRALKALRKNYYEKR